DDSRLQHSNFRLKPGIASANLARARLLVQPTAPLDDHELEMLDGVRDVDPASIDSGLFQTSIEQTSGWAYEGMSLPILLITRLLAHQHHFRSIRTFSEYRLGGVDPEIASPTPGSGC